MNIKHSTIADSTIVGCGVDTQGVVPTRSNIRRILFNGVWRTPTTVTIEVTQEVADILGYPLETITSHTKRIIKLKGSGRMKYGER